MARSPLPVTQPDHDQTQTQTQTHVQESIPSSLSSMPVIALVVRLVTLACLVVSTSLLASNSTTATITTYLSTINFYSSTVTVQFNDIYAYRYALATAVIGVSYTLLQLPFSVHQVRSSKILSNHAKLVYEFLGDKVVLALLATGVGATFGATLDLKRIMDNFDDYFVQTLAITTYSPLRSKMDDFFNRAYFAAVFLLIGFITSGISSLLSSLTLIKNNNT